MAKRENISICFTPSQARFLATCVASGRYQSASEVVREAIRLLEDQSERRRAEIDRACEMIAEGVEQLDCGRVIDRDTFFKDWDDEIERLVNSRRTTE